MCGRYGRRADKQRIAEWFRTHNTNVFDDSELAPTYNAAPQTFQPVIRLNSETGEREIAMMKWGLVPYWILLAKSAATLHFASSLCRDSEQETRN
jgi:putative SOS response-associated peptidase YedK